MPNNYDVGYQKPPIEGQFKKGRSGNPRGRPPKIASEDFDLVKYMQKKLQEKVSIVENGKKKVMSMGEIIATRLVQESARGDAKALKHMYDMMVKKSRINKEEELERLRKGPRVVRIIDNVPQNDKWKQDMRELYAPIDLGEHEDEECNDEEDSCGEKNI